MNLYRDFPPRDVTKHKTVVTVGVFDGVHVGHVTIIDLLKKSAAEQGGLPLLATFDPHPRSLIADARGALPLLYSFAERMQLLEAQGVEHVQVIAFNEEFRRIEQRAFVEEYLIKRWNVGQIVAGYNHSFGKDRAGDRESLIGFGKEYGFQVDIVPPTLIEERPVSSTAIRRLLLDGEIPLANAMLGREFALSGVVVRGFGRGRRLGCPTANLNGFAPGKIIPRDGIYAAVAEFDGQIFPAAVSIGFNPTFNNARHSVESHIIGYEGDLYGLQVTLRFVRRLRGEIKFTSEAALSAQMQQDIDSIRGLLVEHGHTLDPQRLQTESKNQ